MAQNPRIYYPAHAVGFARLGIPHDSTGYLAAKGVQSVGTSTNFNLEQVFQLGQLDIYENIEDIPDVEVTIEKVIDGHALLEHLATPTAQSATLAGRYNDNRCMVAIAFYPTTQDFASGVPLNIAVISGAYVSSIGWTIPVEGNVTESITLVANDKVWYPDTTGVPWTTLTQFEGDDEPVLPSGGVLRRENIMMGTGSLWPTEIPGIDISGHNHESNGSFAAHIQTVSVNVSLNRTELFELGRKGPYFRYAEFPTEVTCSIEKTSDEDDDAIDALSDQDNLTNQAILIGLDHNIHINLGTKNKLQSVTSDGGDTGGGNRTTTYNYSNFNFLRITAPITDPAGLAH